MIRRVRQMWMIAALAAVLAWLHAALAAPQYGDAVDELKAALRVPVRDSANNPEELKFRRANLEKRLKALKVGELRRAIALQEWRDLDTSDPGVANIDSRIRQQLINRLTSVLSDAITKGSTAAKLAAITEIAEIGYSIRSGEARTDVGEKRTPEQAARELRGGLGRQFGPELALAMRDPSPLVRAAAARAMGKINPEPKLATQALGELLTSGDAPERLAAGEGLAGMVQTMLLLNKGTRNTGVEATPEDMAQVNLSVVTVGGKGLSDADPAVRQACLEAVRWSAMLVIALVPDAQRGPEFPPPGRKPTEEELKEIEAYRRAVEAERRTVLPIFRALNAQVPAIVRQLSDPRMDIRILAAHALEQMAVAEQALTRKAESVPQVDRPKGDARQRGREPRSHGHGVVQVSAPVTVAQAEKPKDAFADDPLRQGLLDALPALAVRAVRDPSARVRLAAIDAIEPLGPQAAPVVLTLVRATTDPSLFVRWASARVIGKIGVVDDEVTAATVPALVRLLCDPDLDVELAAINALAQYGAAAAGAVPALTQAVNGGDAERRTTAIHALQSIGNDAEPAIPALALALGYDDTRVRKAAAEALGQFGTLAKAAIPALEKAIKDFDPEVRKAAGDALLAISLGD
ncbi:MAG: HEAT repeat domain-containing protein [Gemmataceae bacterium]|nr:HEAT repeat domain-containing protein [Gemmataceae bacterium]